MTVRSSTRRRYALGAVALLFSLACRGERVDAQGHGGASTIARLVDSLRPSVEQSVGLRFRTPPRSAVRSKAQVRAYLAAKLDQELPPARARGLEAAYRLFGLIPDTLALRPLLLDLLTEQVVGFYDPDSLTLFGVAGTEPAQLRLVLAHEMVHALQGQYLPLDSILEARGDNDRQSAAQAILEGQATLASLRVLAPGQDVLANPAFWQTYREQVRAAQETMPELARAPRVVRESLIFPDLAGAEFMRWWGEHERGMPFGPRMPSSTEQVMYPAHYAGGDAPIVLRFADSATSTAPLGGVLHEDVLGEHEMEVLGVALSGAGAPGDAPIGWGGDRYRIYQTTAGPALVWYTVWDTPAAAERFRTDTGRRLLARGRPGYRGELVALTLEGRPALRYALAPEGWAGWRALPTVGLTAAPGRGAR
jgi:hypothetical protein